MIYYDKKAYKKRRNTILKLLKLLQVCILVLALTGCYNAAMMRVSGEARDTCQSDSDCLPDYMCVKNISADSTLGECVSNDNYDPWANRQLEDIIKLKNKKKVKEEDPKEPPKTTIDNPDAELSHEEIRKALLNLIENAIIEASHLQAVDNKKCQCLQQDE